MVGKVVAVAAAVGTALALFAGCGAQETATVPPDGVLPPRPRASADSCPLTLDGVQADIEATGRGVAINLTASPDQLMLLRARAKDVATAGGLFTACPCASVDDAGAPPASDVGVEEVEGGSRLSVNAKDPSDARTLAKLVRTRLTKVHGGECSHM